MPHICQPTPKLSQLLSQEDQKEIITSLSSSYPYIPSKYTYLWSKGVQEFWVPKGGQGTRGQNAPYFDLHQNYKLFHYLLQLSWKNKKVTVVDFGCGTGDPLRDLNIELRENGQEIAYIPVEFSPVFLKIMEENYRQWLPDLPIKPVIADWDGRGFITPLGQTLQELGDQDSVRLYTCLGATTSNLLNLDVFLSSVLSLMRIGDLLLIDFVQPFSEYSKNVSYYFDEMDWRRQVLEDMGVPRFLMEDEIIYDDIKSRKYIGVKLLEDCLIKLTKCNSEILLQKGTKVELLRSQQFIYSEFLQKISNAGFHLHGYCSINKEFRGMCLVGVEGLK